MIVDYFNNVLIRQSKKPDDEPADSKRYEIVGGPYDTIALWNAGDPPCYTWGPGWGLVATNEPDEIIYIYRLFGERYYYQRYCRREDLEDLLREEPTWTVH